MLLILIPSPVINFSDHFTKSNVMNGNKYEIS